MHYEENLVNDFSVLKFSPGIEDHQWLHPPENVKNLLNRIIENHFVRTRISDERLRLAERLRQMLEEKLHNDKTFGIHSRIEIFGSITSGFGTNSSDVDFCVRFKLDQCPYMKRKDKIFTRHMKKILQEVPGCDMIKAILAPNVPIAKFEWYANADTKMDGDISFSNVLALHNTRLLKQYCQWAPDRLPKLGLFVKQWTQTLGIGSALHGSLSSYAHIILLIFYLQNVDSPVLPRLQKNSAANNAEEMVDGWDVHFIKVVFPGWSDNTSSVGELLIGFFQFYSEFPFANKVVSIRSTSKFPQAAAFMPSDIMIEDPFNLSRNLGSGVKRDMAEFIKKAFATTYRVLTVDFPSTLLNDQEEHDTTSLYSIEEQLLQMSKIAGEAPIRKPVPRINNDTRKNNKPRFTQRRDSALPSPSTQLSPRNSRASNPPYMASSGTSMPRQYPPPTIRQQLPLNSVTVPFSPYVSLTIIP